jgi:glycosyltransferase involved in cell wall biosynthesis
VETLFVPAHTIPLIHPARTVVVVHGLEYEFCPEAYSRWEYWYMRLSIRFSCRVASCIIAVSENTQRDLIRLYAVAAEKIQVVYEGYAQQASEGMESLEEKSSEPARVAKPYFLFIGRLETRKNILRIIEAFEKVKEKHALPHTLVLVGKPGYGYEAIASRRARSRYVGDILELGYVSEVEKWQLLREAEVFVFPTLYEGFGIPVLEAQALGVPVVTSNVSSLPEVAGEGALLVDPTDAEAIAQAMNLLASDIERKNAIIQRGRENVKRFSWETCAREIAEVMWREGK